MVNAESQLAGCFIVFCTCLYKYGGNAIGGFFEAKAQAILKAHQDAEDANISITKTVLATHEGQLEVVQVRILDIVMLFIHYMLYL